MRSSEHPVIAYYLTIDTSHIQAAIGFLGNAGKITLSNLEIKSQENAAISLTSLDESPIFSSNRMLLTLVGRNENTSVQYTEPTDTSKASRRVIIGKEGPILVEPIHAQITLKNLNINGADKIRIYALGPTGARKSMVYETSDSSPLIFSTGSDRTVWYEIARCNPNGDIDVNEEVCDGMDNDCDGVIDEVCGNVDVDDCIGMDDVLCLYQWIIGNPDNCLKNVDVSSCNSCDVNGNGAVDIMDVLCINRRIFGNSSCLNNADVSLCDP